MTRLCNLNCRCLGIPSMLSLFWYLHVEKSTTNIKTSGLSKSIDRPCCFFNSASAPSMIFSRYSSRDLDVIPIRALTNSKTVSTVDNQSPSPAPRSSDSFTFATQFPFIWKLRTTATTSSSFASLAA